jgi:ribosome biogenesis GTPase
MKTNKHVTPNHENPADPCLSALGWSSFFHDQPRTAALEPTHAARVIGIRKNSFYVSNGRQEWLATAAGKIGHRSHNLYPVAGDWVQVADTVIHTVLPRKNALTRGAAGARHRHESLPNRQQVIAANLDAVWIVCGLDQDFNLRRIERYLTLVYNCDLTPVIVLTKADLHANPEALVREVETVAFGVPIHLASATDTACLPPLRAHLTPGRTITLVGSSGAGKSTLINRLYGKSVQATGPTSQKVGKGMHTTTSRDLIVMPTGGMVIDNPGIREIAFWDTGGGIESTFPDIEQLAATCRFSDCSHHHEPGCRIARAVADGTLAPDRLESYLKMQRELSYLSQRRQKSADRLEKERWKDVSLKIKAINKRRRGR